jgi:hypothetical protein
MAWTKLTRIALDTAGIANIMLAHSGGHKDSLNGIAMLLVDHGH